LFHALNAALVWWLAWMVAGRGRGRSRERWAALAATLAALLFAVHAVHVEAVAQIVGRAELMMTAGYLAALIAAQWSRQAPDAGGRWRRALLVLPAAFFASASKEHGVTLPAAVALLALDAFWPRPAPASLAPAGADVDAGSSRDDATPSRAKRVASGGSPFSNERLADALRGTLPSLAMAILGVAFYLVARVAVLGALNQSIVKTDTLDVNPLYFLGGFQRRWGALAILARMGGLLALPINPSPNYGLAVFTPEGLARDPLGWVGLALILATAAAAWAWRRRPLALLGLTWLPVTLALSSNMFLPIGTILGERLLYLPSVMVALVAACLAMAPKRRWARVASIALLGLWGVALTGLHARYLPYWSDNEKLMQYGILRVPLCVNLQYNYAIWSAMQKRLDVALVHLDEAHRIAPANHSVATFRASMMGTLDRPGAEEALEKEHVIDPAQEMINKSLIEWLSKHGKMKRAEEVMRDRVHYNPTIVEAWRFLANYLVTRGRLAEAEDVCVKCRDYNIDNVDALIILAKIRAKTGHQLDDALRAAKRALELEPGKLSALEALGWVLERQGKPQEAIIPLRQVVIAYEGDPQGSETYFRLINAYLACPTLKPDDVALLNDLANYLAEEGRDLNTALIAAKRALKLRPDTPEIRDTVGLVLTRQGKPKDAIPFLEKAAAAYRDNPDGADVYMHLADAYAKAGRADDARKTSEVAKALAARSIELNHAGQSAPTAQPAAASDDSATSHSDWPGVVASH
jgi:tetratricopeptide (TPR) repeat protein